MRLAVNFQRVDPSRGGAETYVADLCGSLVRLGHQVDLYAESWREGVLPDEVRCVAVEAPGRTRMARTWNFARNSEAALRGASYDCTVGLINTWHHDVIIPQGGVHRASLESNARRFASGWRRTLYRLGKVANPRFWTYQAIERRQYDPDRQARAVAVSNLVRGHLLRYHRIARTRITVIPNAIDADRLQVAQPGAVRCAFRNQIGLKPDDLVGLFVGHNYWLKGLKPLLTALARRKEDFPAERPVHLLVSGAGKAAPILRVVRRLGLEGTVHVAGFVPDIRACYWSSDFFVSPTYYDPCSLAVLEALACGLPAITTACNGAGELMTNGREGYVIPEPDALDELAGAIGAMTDDRARRQMAEHAAQLGRSHTFDHHVAKLVRVFEEVAATRVHRGPHAAIAKSTVANVETKGRVTR